MKEIQAQIEYERKQLEKDKNMEESKRNKLAEKLMKREKDLKKAMQVVENQI